MTPPYRSVRGKLRDCNAQVTTISTVGYGDITADTPQEKTVAIIGMFVGGFCFSMLIGNLGSVLTMESHANMEYKKQSTQLREFLQLRNVPLRTRRKVLVHYDNFVGVKTGVTRHLPRATCWPVALM